MMAAIRFACKSSAYTGFQPAPLTSRLLTSLCRPRKGRAFESHARSGIWTEPLKYTQVCHGGVGEGVGRGDATYNTCMLPNGSPFFVAAFAPC